MSETRLPVTYLFVPAHESRKVAKALASEADAVILDLEDSVPASQKAAARAQAAAVLSERPIAKEVWVRVNADAGFGADLAAIDWQRATGAVLPKAERSDRIGELALAGVRRTILLVESAVGLFALRAIVEAAPHVERVAIGTWDLSLDLGLIAIENPDDAEIVWQARGAIVLESRRLGLPAPIDGVWANLDDEEGLRASCLRASRLGFGAKLIIHPAQVPAVRSAFLPDEETLARAAAIVAAYHEAERQDRGAIKADGKMIDRPVFERARLVLARAGRGTQ